MTPDELPAVAIEVSVMSAPRPLRVSSPGEAYAALHPGVDGVILESGACQNGDTAAPDVAAAAGPGAVPRAPVAQAGHPARRLARGHDAADVHRPRLARGIRSAQKGVRGMHDDNPLASPASDAASPGVATWPDAPTAQWWSARDKGRLRCDLCPRRCRLDPGQRGFCFVRARDGDRMVLTTYGRSSGFAIDPVEKKPLSHFCPGTAVLPFGTAGCNLNCGFCQNWDISTSRGWDRLAAVATPEGIARAAESAGCDSVAFTYNDPVIFAENAIDTAVACHERGLHTLAVTAGYIAAQARAEFFTPMVAANIDLKGFTEDFYWKETGSQLRDVLDTIVWVHQHTDTWLELTTLLIPGCNDARDEVERMCRWILAELGPDVPLHFSAFHPDFEMLDVPSTPPATLGTARATAIDVGLHFVYTGNVHDPAGETTPCPTCGHVLIERDWYAVSAYEVTADARCPGVRNRCARPVRHRRPSLGSALPPCADRLTVART